MKYLRCTPDGDILSSGESTFASGVLLQRRAPDEVFWVSDDSTGGSVDETCMKVETATGRLIQLPNTAPWPGAPIGRRYSQLTE